MFNDVTNNVIIPAAGAKSSENLKLEIIRTLEQLNYQGNCPIHCNTVISLQLFKKAEDNDHVLHATCRVNLIRLISTLID